MPNIDERVKRIPEFHSGSIKRCPHDIYMPDADAPTGKSWGCTACFPDGHPETTRVPVLPRSSADVLGRDNVRENCSNCGNLRTYFAPNCRHCGALFPDVDVRSVTTQQHTRLSPGACPECRSAIHYETDKKSVWLCADCGTEYKAPKLKEQWSA